MPDTPVAAPAASSAPVSTPAPSTPSTPSTPVTPDVPAPAAPSTDTGTPSTPSTPAADPFTPSTKGPEPTQANFPGDVTGFLEARDAWLRGEEVTLPELPKVDPAAAEPVVDDAKPQGDGDDDPVNLLEDEPQGYETPESLQGALDGAPELKAVLDANPQVRNKVFAMARENSKLRPLGDIFPSVEAAQFANQTADKFVGLRTNIMSASNEAEMAPVVQSFFDEFKLVDGDGKPILDAAGQPQYGEDMDVFSNTLIKGRIQISLDKLTADIEGGKLTESQLDDAELRRSAAQMTLEMLSGDPDEPVKPDYSNMPEDVRKKIEEREAAIAKREEELGVKKTANKKEEAKTARVAAESRFTDNYGNTFAQQIDSFLAQQKASNAFIPSFATEYLVDNGHGQKVPMFGKNVLDAYQARIASVPSYKARLAELKLAPVTEQNEKARADYAKQLIETELPPILRAELKKIQTKESADRDARRVARTKRGDARVEPQSGATPGGEPMLSKEQAMAKARETVAAKFPNLHDAARLTKTLEEYDTMRRSG